MGDQRPGFFARSFFVNGGRSSRFDPFFPGFLRAPWEATVIFPHLWGNGGWMWNAPGQDHCLDSNSSSVLRASRAVSLSGFSRIASSALW